MLFTLLFLAAASDALPKNVGGFSYRTIISDRTKPVKAAPAGYPRTWTQHLQIIVGADAKDAEFSRLMRRQALRAQRDFEEEGDACKRFESCEAAGSLDISEELLSASPDLISVRLETSFYEAGMPHPGSAGVRNYIWSRRLHRLLKEGEVFAVRPDRRLRRLAQAKFDNRQQIEDDANGIPLDWDHASIGRDGITWFYSPYELGSYLSAGTATVNWSALKPYLRSRLPFAISRIHSAPTRFTR